jgi:CRP/FNR family cyclic AMP-dependent transcriptional regulator
LRGTETVTLTGRRRTIMETKPISLVRESLEDPLNHLPRSAILSYSKGKTVYTQDQPSTGVYLVIDGGVKVSRMSDRNVEVILDIYKHDEFFGECALLGFAPRAEIAVAIENRHVMNWTTEEIEDLVAARPKLGIALLQMVVQRSIGFGSRIEGLALNNIAFRLSQALIRFSERFGKEHEDGSVEMMPLTHLFLAQYVGTKRELVSSCMKRFRRDGYLQYSRRGIVLQPALRSSLAQNSRASTGAAFITNPAFPPRAA